MSRFPDLTRFHLTKKRTAIYVGCTDMNNLGDEVVVDAIQALLHKSFAFIKFSYKHKSWSFSILRRLKRNPDIILIGGGTIITKGANESYLKIILQLNKHWPNSKIFVFGAGVADQKLARDTGFPIDTISWVALLNRCEAITVRGPISRSYLKDWGVTQDITICGDPAILFSNEKLVRKRKSKTIGVNFCNILDRIYGHNNQLVEEFAIKLVHQLLNNDWNILLISTADSDLQYMSDMFKSMMSNRVKSLPLGNLKTTLHVLESVDIMIGQRLHSIIFASLVHTPFLAIEYESKTRDFLSSLGFDDRSMRTDQLNSQKAFEELTALYENLDHEQNRLFDSVLSLKKQLVKSAENLSKR